MDQADGNPYFAFFNEVGIIAQLSRAMFEARLPDGVSVAHFSVLNHLVRLGDGRTPLEIASAFQVPKTTMTHTLAGLQARKLVEMRPHPSDGRSKRVWLTGKGRKFRDDAIGLLAPEMERLAAHYPLEKLADMVPRLAELRQLLDRMRD